MWRINILPVSETKTVAAFSYAKQDQGIVHAALDRILGSTGDVQKYELSKLVLSRISNVLISPRHFDQWGAEKAKKITDAFVRTVQSQPDVGEDVDFHALLRMTAHTGRFSPMTGSSPGVYRRPISWSGRRASLSIRIIS